MWAVVEGKRNHRTMSPNSINNIGCQSLYRAQDREGFHPEHHEPRPQESGSHQEDAHRVYASSHAGREPTGFSVIDFLCYIHFSLGKWTVSRLLRTWRRCRCQAPRLFLLTEGNRITCFSEPTQRSRCLIFVHGI